jgi:hypothetical protein
MKASGATSMAPRWMRAWRLVEVHHVVHRVVERAEVGVHLLGEVAGEEAQLLAGLHRGAREDDALHLRCISALTAMAMAR